MRYGTSDTSYMIQKVDQTILYMNSKIQSYSFGASRHRNILSKNLEGQTLIPGTHLLVMEHNYKTLLNQYVKEKKLLFGNNVHYLMIRM